MPDIMKNKKNFGFTLVEVLIVTVILAIISLAIFSTFSNGIKIYNRINSKDTLADLAIFCDRFGQDLRNSINSTLINFIGKAEELEFASLLNSPRMKMRSVSLVKYVWDSSSEKIKRFTSDYSGVYNQEELSSRQSLDKVKSCQFRYYYLDNLTKSFLWAEEWNKDGLPAAVRMELELKNRPETKFTRTFNIPTGILQNEKK
jgi:prepilin-type N-terminal cleavage/methylation domain-containing protein